MSELTLGQLRELAKKHGKKYGREFVIWAQQNGILNNPTDFNRIYREKTAKNAEYKDYNEYSRSRYKNNIEDNRRYLRERLWDKGSSPMSENDSCSSYFGVYIGENLFKEYLLTIFERVEIKDYGNHGYDFVCKNPIKDFINKYPQFKLVTDREYKIQLKLKCLYHRIDCRTDKSPQWRFDIKNNNIPDIFILAGFDDRESLQPIHVWLFLKYDMIRKGNSYTKIEKFWKRDSFTITDNPEYIKRFEKHEIPIDKLEELCNEINEDQ